MVEAGSRHKGALNDNNNLAVVLLEMEKEVMEMIASNRPLVEVLTKVVLNFEAIVDQSICSILLMGKDGQHVLHGVGPSLPDAYNQGINGEPIGPIAGSCGTAAFRKERVMVSDIANDPLWINYRDFALSFGLKASWSTPIVRNDGLVLGTFAIYYKTIKEPEAFDLELIDRAANQVKIALEQNLRATQLLESEEKYRTLTEAIPDSITRYDAEMRYTYMNQAALKMSGFKLSQIIGKTHREVGFEKDEVIFLEETIGHVLSTGEIVHRQFEWKVPDGLVYLDWQLTPELDKQGKVKSVLGVARDITSLLDAQNEIKKREKFLAIIADNFPKSYLAVIGNQLEILFMGGEEFSKLSLDANNYIGKTTDELFKPYGEKVVNNVNEAYQRTFRGESQVFEVYVNHQYLQIKTVPLFSDDGAVNSILTVTENITETRIAENELAKSELLFRRLTSSAPVAIFQTDNNGKCIYVNEEWIRFSGVSFNNAMGDGWTNSIHPEDRERVWHEWSTAIATKREFKSQLRFLKKNGVVTWLTAKAVALYDAHQSVYGYIGTATDITEHKKVNQIIEESEERYRTTLERITDGFVALDRDWRYTYMNNRAGEIFDRIPDEMVGKNIWMEFPEGVGQPFHQAYETAMREQKYVYLEEYYAPYDSWFENHIYPSQGGLSIYFKDITERKKAEAEILRSNESLEQAEEQVGLGSWEVYIGTDKRRWSKQLFRLFGYQPGDKPIEHDELITRVHPDDRENFLNGFNAMKIGVEPQRVIIRTNPEILPLKYLLPSWHIERDKVGQTTKFRGTIQDVTDQILAEQKIRESEVRYRGVVEQSLTGVYIIKGDYFTYVNPQFARIFGYEHEEMLSSFKAIDIIFEEDKLLVSDVVNKRLERKDASANYKFRGIKKDGSIIYVEVFGTLAVQDGVNVTIGTLLDITEKEYALRALEMSENRLRTILDNEPECVKVLSKKGELIDMNPAGLAMIEADSLAQVKGKEMINLVNPPYQSDFKKLIKNVLNGNAEKLAFEITGLKGGLRWLETHSVPLKDAEGNITSLLGVTRDITERKIMEESLRDQRDVFEKITKTAPGLIYTFHLGLSGTMSFPFTSAAVNEVFGFSSEELKNDASRAFALVSKEELDDLLQSITSSSLSLSQWQYEFRYNHPQRGEIWLEGKSLPIRESDGSTTWHGVMIEITEQKQTEKEKQLSLIRNRQTLNTMMDGFMLADLNGKIIELNPAICKMFNYEEEELNKKSISDLNVDLSEDELKELIKLIVDKQYHKFEAKGKRKDKVVIDIEVSASVMYFNEQPLISAFVKDITERKRIEEKLAHYTNQLRDLTAHLQNIREEERAALSRDLHDELGQQLTAIKMDLSWLNKKTSDEALNAKIGETMQVANDAVTTIRRINSDLRPSLLDDLGLFPAMQYQVEEFGKRYNIASELKIEMEEPQLNDQCSIAIFRIFQETLTNVAKHAQATSVSATLKKHENNIQLIVSDNGRGFNMVGAGNKGSFGILGMTERAMMMNGVIKISSRPGEGTTMKLSVPI